MSHAICLVHYLGIFNNYAVSVRQRALEKQDYNQSHIQQGLTKERFKKIIKLSTFFIA